MSMPTGQTDRRTPDRYITLSPRRDQCNSCVIQTAMKKTKVANCLSVLATYIKCQMTDDNDAFEKIYIHPERVLL